MATLAGWEKGALLGECDANAVPASPINTIEEMFDDPQVKSRGMQLSLDDGHGTALPSVRAPIALSKTPLSYERPSPRLGEHTAEILREIGEDSE